MKKIFISVFVSALIIAGSFLINNPKDDYRIKKEKGPDMRPTEWAFLQRTFPYFNANLDAYSVALKQVNEMRNKQNKFYKGKNLVPWEFAGPVNIGGRIVDIEFNPIEPNIVYAGAATGGVFKSTDTGANWTAIFDDAATLSIGDICIDPINPDIIYVGTGEANGGHNNFPGGGIYKSTDAGATWSCMGLEKTAAIGRVIIDPTNTNRVFAAAVGSYFAPNSERGLYLSTDAGITWNKSLFVSDTTGCIDVVINPENSNLMLAAMWERVRQPGYAHLYGPTSGMYKSTDAGTTWVKVVNGLPNPSNTDVGRIGLATSSTQPNLVYSIINDGYNYIGLYKSTNFGDNWTNVDTDNEISAGVSNFSWYFGQVRINPADHNKVYVLDVSFMRSTNGGTTFPIIYGYGGPDELHVDHHALAFHPNNPNYLIEGNDGGINISTDGGVTWQSRVQLPITQFYEIWVDALDPKKLYGGTQDNNTIRTLTGALDDWEAILGGDGMYVIVDYTNSNIIYAESQWGNLAKSIDGGVTFNYALNGISGDEPTNWSTPVVIDPLNPNILYYGTDRVYRTTNKASSWTAISPKLTSGFYSPRLGTVTTIAIAPSNTNYIYAGTDDSYIWVSKNNGTNWTKISSGLPTRWVTRLVVDPLNENTVYATFSGLRWKDPESHVYKSTNAGETWIDISANLPDSPVNAFAVYPANTNVLCLGSDIGMFISYNKGESWEVLGAELPVVPINDMKIDVETNTLVIGTHGRGMYKINLATILSNLDASYSMQPEMFKLSQNYPNPFNPQTTIEFYIPKEGKVAIILYNAVGELVEQLVNTEYPEGNHKVIFNAKNLSSGVYYYKMVYNNKYSKANKMVFMK